MVEIISGTDQGLTNTRHGTRDINLNGPAGIGYELE